MIQHPCFEEIAVSESDNRESMRWNAYVWRQIACVGARRPWPRFAEAFRSDGEGMVQLGGSGT